METITLVLIFLPEIMLLMDLSTRLITSNTKVGPRAIIIKIDMDMRRGKRRSGPEVMVVAISSGIKIETKHVANPREKKRRARRTS